MKGITSAPSVLEGARDATPDDFVRREILGRNARSGSGQTVYDRISSIVAPRKILFTSVALAVGIVTWAVVNLVNGWVGFAAVVPVGFRGGGEAAISLARLFAALVLILIVVDGIGDRLRWVACGFLVLGLGQLVFGYLEPIFENPSDLNESLYEMILVRTVAGALFVTGLVPRSPPRFTLRAAAGVFLVCGVSVVCYGLLEKLDAVPELVRTESLEEAARLGIAPMSWLTPWHWVLAALPFGLAILASVGAIWRNQDGEIGAWLPISVVLLAGSELHDSLWPSTYNSVLMNTADVLRLAMAVVVVVGGTLELRRIASERAALLADEQERSRRLKELGALKADFTAMVAHELGYPLSAVRRLTEMLSRDGLDTGLRNHALATIIKETNAMDNLVADIQATAVVERNDFEADIRPVELSSLIQDAEEMAANHSRNQPLETTLDGVDGSERVLADPDRIGQVLRNLLCNAAKFSPEGTLISIRAIRSGEDRIRIEVADRGPGICPDDLARIFEKFGRGVNGESEQVSGAGLGLYLSRRIVRAHGSDLTVRSQLGVGSVFAFELVHTQSVLKGYVM